MLRQFRGKLLLKSELLLEEFIWLNLSKLLKINPLKRQYVINNKSRTDILGITHDQHLVIIELKKQSGKESIDQLIRYRDNILKHSWWSSILSEVNFNKDFVLIAIAGYFSKQAQEYAINMLPEALLFSYEIQKTQKNEYLLILRKQNHKIYSQVSIDIMEDSLFESLPPFLQGYLIDNIQERVTIISIIKKILDFSNDIKFETFTNYNSNDTIQKYLLFGKYDRNGKIINNKICAEFSYHYSRDNKKSQLYLSVYLPTFELSIRNYKRKKLVDGIVIHTDDFIHVKELIDNNTVISKASKIPLRYPLKNTEINETYSSFKDYYINYRKYMKSRKTLRSIDHHDFTLVANIVQMALEDWSVR